MKQSMRKSILNQQHRLSETPTIRQVQSIFRICALKTIFVSGYGMTECSGTFCPPKQLVGKVPRHTVGLPVPSTKIKVHKYREYF